MSDIGGGECPRTGAKKKRLRCGFSTGTAAVAAARAALRRLLAGWYPEFIAVRLPSGIYLPVPVKECCVEGARASACVVKDAGDDPDVTDKAEICAHVTVSRVLPLQESTNFRSRSGVLTRGIYLAAGRGVGMVTKPGLPVAVGEPAINPVPREMFSVNLTEELIGWTGSGDLPAGDGVPFRPAGQGVYLPFSSGAAEMLPDMAIEVSIEVPRGVELAQRTLNPRLGILGGISILGTTGIVRPFSNEAYEETIHAALSVAASSGCSEVVLSTGGKSERLAAEKLRTRPAEAFVQIADFFGYAVREAVRFGFRSIVHSAFFGKVVKMAQGHTYTHAHSVPLDLGPLARMAGERGYDSDFCAQIAGANTARHALELLREESAADVIEAAGRLALEQSGRFAGRGTAIRLLLFDYDGTLLLDLSGAE